MKDAVLLINRRLKEAEIPVAVRLHGRSLYLRATLPCKPGDGWGRKRYEIPLRIPSTEAGLKRAEREAHKLAQRLADGSFDWRDYRDPAQDTSQMAIAQLVEKFSAHYLATNKIKPETWESTWAATFRKLPQDRPLTEGNLLGLVLLTRPDSRPREQVCQRLQALANFAELPIDLSPHVGDYEPLPREIPPDDAIEEWRDRIENPAWQWVYGMLTAFGMRPHEVLQSRMLDDLRAEIPENTKTGYRIARAIHPRWAEEWRLIEMVRPNTHATEKSLRCYAVTLLQMWLKALVLKDSGV